jgi:hypothetical protein
LESIKQAGYDGVQFVSVPSDEELAVCRSLGLETAGSGRINQPGEIHALVEGWGAISATCCTLHVGWGIESQAEAYALIDDVLAASSRSLPLYVETHRATIFQDIWRTVEFVKRYPDLRFNGDFSHWYTGQEMVYGGFHNKLSYIEPVLERVRFIHGRIGNPGCIQVRVPDVPTEREYVQHFRQLWTKCFGYGATIFVPELLAPDIYYARTVPDVNGQEIEESNRWEQSLVLRRIAEECFKDSQNQSALTPANTPQT